MELLKAVKEFLDYEEAVFDKIELDDMSIEHTQSDILYKMFENLQKAFDDQPFEEKLDTI